MLQNVLLMDKIFCALNACWVPFGIHLEPRALVKRKRAVLCLHVILHLLYFVGLPEFSQHNSSKFPTLSQITHISTLGGGPYLEPVLEVVEMFDMYSVFRIHYPATYGKNAGSM